MRINLRSLIVVTCSLILGICGQDADDPIRKFDFAEEAVQSSPVNQPIVEGDYCELKDGSSGRYLTRENCEDDVGPTDQPLSDPSGNLFCCRNYPTYMVEKVCKRLTEKDRNVPTQHPGGNQIQLGDFPHVATIGYKRDDSPDFHFRCLGTLISDLFVLVAAHCISNEARQPNLVRLGTVDFRESLYSNQSEYTIAQTIAHPEYDRLKKINDIGLVRLATKVKRFSRNVHPACLDFGLEDPRTTMISVILNTTAMVMQKSNMVTVNHKECEAHYKTVSAFTRYYTNGFPPTQMCASMAFNHNSCMGLMGGLNIPVENTSSVYTVVGIISYGKRCDLDSPDVYTRVSKYLPWITKTVWPEGDISFADDF